MGTASFKSFDPGGTRRYFTSAGREIFSSVPASVARIIVVPEMFLIVPTVGGLLAGTTVCPDASAPVGCITAGHRASRKYAQPAHPKARQIRSLNMFTQTSLQKCP